LGHWLHSQTRGNFWLPPRGSTAAAAGVDWTFHFILWVCYIFFFLILALMTAFVIRYRRRAGQGPKESPHHNLALKITWTVIPVIIVLLIFYFGFTNFMNMSIAPDNAYQVLVTGQKWK